MPLQRPHYWSEDSPVTTNQTYGWHLHEYPEPVGYSAKGKYMVINKPMPDLTYRKVVVKRSKKQSSDRLILPPAVGARGDARKPLNDSTYWSSSPPYFDGANPRKGLDMFATSQRKAPSSDYFSDQARKLLYESLDYGYGKLIAEQKARRSQSASQLAAMREEEKKESKVRPKTGIPFIPADDIGLEVKPLYLWHTNSGYLVRVVP
ncbi:uncharacterized protein LOC106177840 [Lingula anatina]|uniref:Uncharacterized protein LOC106177840 n=1 Tax=Lingula anatina TaxID=7574 RepID=A0A1S3K1D2_LINAN|nr:uncharacterized protein LOC106177840 [Lingula anatina]|eukprot:XP_013416199.1 uncharacterized protein LOC106177840 [Lingula anatina]